AVENDLLWDFNRSINIDSLNAFLISCNNINSTHIYSPDPGLEISRSVGAATTVRIDGGNGSIRSVGQGLSFRNDFNQNVIGFDQQALANAINVTTTSTEIKSIDALDTQIKNVLAPTDPNDAATRQFVLDEVANVGGGSSFWTQDGFDIFYDNGPVRVGSNSFAFNATFEIQNTQKNWWLSSVVSPTAGINVTGEAGGFVIRNQSDGDTHLGFAPSGAAYLTQIGSSAAQSNSGSQSVLLIDPSNNGQINRVAPGNLTASNPTGGTDELDASLADLFTAIGIHQETTATTDASGDLTIAHTLGAVPGPIQLSVSGTTIYHAQYHTKTSTDFKVRITDALGAPVTATAITISYHIKE
ncbi:MAG: hypothetical protein AAFY91_13045, partial [Bacteroidota bacterium]